MIWGKLVLKLRKTYIAFKKECQNQFKFDIFQKKNSGQMNNTKVTNQSLYSQKRNELELPMNPSQIE